MIRSVFGCGELYKKDEELLDIKRLETKALYLFFNWISLYLPKNKTIPPAARPE